jgi:hypothetical protein
MRKYLILIIPLLLVAFLSYKAYAQDHASNIVITKIGTPPTSTNGGSVTDPSSCPIPNGSITCGSERVPVGGCGHCGVGYGDYSCSYEGIHYAMDVGAKPGDPVYMPLVDGKKIRWTFSHQQINDSLTAIQYYGGVDEDTQEQYWIQFHHTVPGSGGGSLYSGDQGATVCAPGCSTGSGPHVHIEFAKISDSGTRVWQDAPNYFCR